MTQILKRVAVTERTKEIKMVINTWKAPLQIASALFLASALLSGGWAVRPAAAQETPPQAAALQRASAQREATYQEQLTQLEQAFAEHQTTYQQQLDEMNQRLTQSQAQVHLLANQEQAL